MAQVKIFGIKEHLKPLQQQLSDVVHQCVMEALQFPADKKAQRFFPLDKENIFYPVGRTGACTIIEITMIEGRTVEAKKQLIRLLFDNIQAQVGIKDQDIEICIYESPSHNWGIRGQHGDEVRLSYNINV